MRPQLRGMARAVYSPVAHVASAPGSVTLGAPNDAHRAKCEQHRDAVEQALSAHSGSPVAIELVVDGGGGTGAGGSDGGGSGEATPTSPAPTPAASAPASAKGSNAQAPDPARATSTNGALAHDNEPKAEIAPDPAHLTVVPAVDITPPADEPPVLNGRAIAEDARSRGPEPDPDDDLQQVTDTLPEDDDVDIDDLVDAPPEAVKTPIDRLADAFPGSELVDDQY